LADRVTQQSRVCPNCGTRRPVNATKCPKCGTPAPADAPEADDDFFTSHPFDPPPSRWRSLLDHATERIQHTSMLAVLQRVVAFAALIVILIAVAYAVLPFKTGTRPTRVDCGPAIVSVFDRARVPPAPAPAVVTPAKPVLKPCTHQAQRRLAVAVPIIVLSLIGAAGARRILS
jgi:hypothetical protein